MPDKVRGAEKIVKSGSATQRAGKRSGVRGISGGVLDGSVVNGRGFFGSAVIALTIRSNPLRQGKHDLLAGGTRVIRARGGAVGLDARAGG